MSSLDFGDMFGAKKKKKTDEDPLLGDIETGIGTDSSGVPKAGDAGPAGDVEEATGAVDDTAAVFDPTAAGQTGETTGYVEGGPDDPNLPQSQAEQGDPNFPRPWTYEQTWIDPFVKKGVMGRQGLTGGVAFDEIAQADAAPEFQQTLGELPDYQRGLEARGYQRQNLDLLQSLASGVPSQAIEMEKERGLQAVQATASSMRGAPTSAVQRAMNQGFSEVNRNAMEAHAKQQLQASQMVNEFASQMRAQDLSLVDLQGQYQQQANLSNAQMANEMRQAEAQINVQLEQQRDAMVNSLVQQGVDRNLALAQISAEMSRLQEELFYKYWAGKLGAMTEIGKELILETGATESVGSQFAQERDVLAMYGGYPTVPGYAVPSTSIREAGEMSGSDNEGWWLATEDQGGWIWDTASGTYVRAGPTGTEYYWDFTSGSWKTRAGGQPTSELVSSKYAKQNIKSMDEFYGAQDPQEFGQMSGAYEYTNPVDRPLGQMRGTGQLGPGVTDFGKLGEVKPGLQPGAAADYPQWMRDLPLEPIPGQRFDPRDSLNKLNTAVANAPSGKQWQEDYRSAKEDVAGYVKIGQIGALGGKLLMGDREERKNAGTALVGLGIQEAITGGIAGVESFLTTSGETKDAINAAVSGIYGSNVRKIGDEVSKAVPEQMSGEATQIANELADETANAVSLGANPLSAGSQKLGEKVSETVLAGAGEQAVEEGAASAAGSMAPFIGGAVQATQAALTGGAPLPTGIRVAGSVGGAVGGAAAGSSIGTAIAPGIGTAIGSGIGSTVGALGGGMASAPLAMAFERNRIRQGRSPLGGIHEPGTNVGAPTVFSGMETKGFVEGVSTSITPGEPYFQPSTGRFETARDARGVPMYQPSGAGTKSGIDSASDNDLSNFLRTINPVTFDYKPEYGGEKNQYGIIAEDAEQSPVGQTFVKQNGNGTKVIDTGKATMVNMAALANQQRILDRQGQMIAELLGRRG